jgi:hypothetical protein
MHFPFILFAFDPCVRLLSHSRTTAYDRDGNCVPAFITKSLLKTKYSKSNNNNNNHDDKGPVDLENKNHSKHKNKNRN